MLEIQRNFTTEEEEHSFDAITWIHTNVKMTDLEGNVTYELLNGEFPAEWSELSRNITASRYFRESRDSSERESSVQQMIHRVVSTITDAGISEGYFDKENGESFSDELTYILLHQMASFNSPVWFNLGVGGTDEKPQCSACFINEVNDNMDSILELCTKEGLIFKGGSGSGVNLSNLRASTEHIRGGGTASGPVSFMSAYDAIANVILSGGRTRRAARMVILDADHPDIEKFIWCKADQEDIVEILAEADIPTSYAVTNNAYTHVKHQSGNNSIRIPDEFMEQVKRYIQYREDSEWALVNRDNKEVARTISVKNLFKQIAAAAHKCGDPGVQFGDTINTYNTCANDGEITASNPCFTGDTLIATPDGPVSIRELCEIAIATHKMTPVITVGGVVSTPTAYMTTGIHKILHVQLSDGRTLSCTKNHQWLIQGAKIEAKDLEIGMPVTIFDETELVITRITEGKEEPTYNLTEPLNNLVYANGILIPQCSEFVWHKNSACNLASINLRKFDKGNRTFDTKAFRHVVYLLILAQDIIVNLGGYPTPEIEKNTHIYRPLGLGFANLGGLLMSWGIPYDSQEGREIAASIASLLTGQAYLTSAEIAQLLGAFKRFEPNREPMEEVLDRHLGRTRKLAKDTAGVSSQALKAWQEATGLGFGRKKSIKGDGSGFRNAQVTLLAPTGTVAFQMGCDTTGIEPDSSLSKLKTIVGGGNIAYQSNAVKSGLAWLGYTEEQQKDLLDYVAQNGHLEGSSLKPEHLAVFDCAFRPDDGDRSLSVDAHLDMVAAVQPFLSGAVSKTFNMDNSATPEDIERTFLKAWEKHIKCVAIYRRGSKLSEPLRAKELAAKKIVRNVPQRMDLPDDLDGLPRHKFRVGNHKGYIHVGVDPDDPTRPIEVFFRMSSIGSTVSGLLDSYATLFSIALQYNIPLEELLEHMAGPIFPPQGMTSNPKIRSVNSVLGYLYHFLRLKFIDIEDISIEGVSSSIIPMADTGVSIDGEPCPRCGGLLERTGTCAACRYCGYNDGTCS
jgi:ribonucleotide reductase alpha subunit